jgi:broad specificity phosphatase PhoE
MRLLLVRHGTTHATRRALFPSTNGSRASEHCEGLDRAGRAQAERLRDRLPAVDRCWSSHALRARETAALLGHLQAERLCELAEGDFGTWSGRSLDEVHASDPAALARWLADPEAAPHGGETLTALRARARTVLERAAALGGTTLAVSHGGFIKAAVLETLALPAPAIWRIDVAPGSLSELRAHGEHWQLAHLNWLPELTRPAGTR